MVRVKQNKKADQKLSKNVTYETLTESEHKLFLEGCKSKELLDAYNDLQDLEFADLEDFFRLENRDGRI